MPNHDQMQRLLAATESCQGSRGWMITSFAQVEFLLGDTPLRAWRLPAFSYLRAATPVHLHIKIAAMRSLLNSASSDTGHAISLSAIIDRIERFQELRHFLVHGFLSIDYTAAGEMALRFRRWKPTSGGGSELLELDMRLEELQAAEAEWRQVATDFVPICAMLRLELGWTRPDPNLLE